MRTFDTGATRDTDQGKFDYEGFLSPLVLEAFAAYMHKHRIQADGSLRDSDNWQKGIPRDAYIKSGFRHFMDWWREHRGIPTDAGVVEALCALMFNVQGYLHEMLMARPAQARGNTADDVWAPVLPVAVAVESQGQHGYTIAEHAKVGIARSSGE